ncbi:MAG: hypothetical protein ACE5FK_02450 [Candidatus Methylomirabilia bacterium]
MGNLISGLIALSMVVAFLGFYAVTLRSIALWIIIVAILSLTLLDFAQSVRKGKGQTGD